MKKLTNQHSKTGKTLYNCLNKFGKDPQIHKLHAKHHTKKKFTSKLIHTDDLSANYKYKESPCEILALNLLKYMK